MSLIKRAQKQKLVYWPYSGADRHGQPTYGTAVEMSCRWDDAVKQIFTTEGSPVFSSIELITQVRIQPKGMVWLGKLSQVTSATVPRSNSGVREVIMVASTPTIRNTETLYEAWA